MSGSKGSARRPLRERDLAAPIYRYLHANGFEVRSEVGDCDIAASKGGELVVIELKRSLSIDLLLQATQRQRAADSVYVAIPWPEKGTVTKRFRQLSHLLRRLELGLILVSASPTAPRMEVLFHPLPLQRRRDPRKRRAILAEIAGRSADFNWAGSVHQPLVTAYRESSIFVACCLERFGPSKPARLRSCGTGPKTLSILQANYYGWFERVERGVYSLSAAGRAGLATYTQLAALYRRRLAAQESPETDADRPAAASG